MRKKILSVFLILCLSVTTSVFFLPEGGAIPSYAAENTTEFAGGDGTAGNPYKISTPAQLNNVSNYLNNGNVNFLLLNDIVFTPEHFDGNPDNQPAGEDFYNLGYGWNPIGYSNASYQFKGVFDGGNHTISGLYIKRNRWDLTCSGLFGYNKGVIKNLKVSDSSINAVSGGNLGAIAGINAGQIINCENTVDITIPKLNAPFDVWAGGIAGYSYIGTITNCKNSGNISVYGRTNAFAGGIAGYCEMGTVSASINTGDLFASVEPSDYTPRYAGAGGIAGRSYYTNIQNSYNVGDAASVNIYTSQSYSGGIAGLGNNGTFTSCLTLGHLAASGSEARPFPTGVTKTNCFYLDNNSANTDARALTWAEFAQTANFTGFDFTTVWEMNPVLDRPTLRTNAPIIATSVEIGAQPIVLRPGQALPLPLVTVPRNAETNLTLASSSPAVLGASSGNSILSAISLGSATVTLEDLVNGGSQTAEVVVGQPVTSLSIEGSTQLDKGSTVKFQTVIAPENAYDKSVTWEVRDPEIASVNASGEVTGLKGGMTSLYATANFGAEGLSRASWVIRVVEHAESVEITTLDTYQLQVGGASHLYATVLPTGAVDRTVSWSSSNPSVVSVDAQGGIIGKSAGTSTVTVTTNDGGKQASCTITVVSLPQSIRLQTGGFSVREFTLAPGVSLQLDPAILPADSDPGDILWKSSDALIASVDQNGLVQATGSEGSATISATTANGNRTASCLIVIGTTTLAGIQWTPPTELTAGKSFVLPVTLLPAEATALRWKSSDESVATVDAFGRITGIGPGTAVIAAAASDAGGSASSFVINVTQVFPIRYVLNGGNPLPFGSAGYKAPLSMTLPVPTKTGSTFLGWYEDADFGGDPVTAIPAGSRGPRTYYAKWQANLYPATWHSPATGTTTVVDTLYGETLTAPSFSRTGYQLTGWTLDPELLAPLPAGSTMPARAIDLYAKWQPITYYLNCQYNKQVTLRYDEAYTLPLPSNNTGYAFDGWGTSPEGPALYTSQQSVKNLATQPYAVVSLYEIWSAPIRGAVSSGYDRATVTWAAAQGATGYRIERATSAAGPYTPVYTASASARSWTNTGLVTGKTYYFRVTTIAGAFSYGNDSYKAVKPIPATPSVSLAKASSTSMKISWSAVAGATKYQVYRSTSLNGTYTLAYTAAGTTTSWTNTGLTAGKTYYYKVRAYHLEGTVAVYGGFSAAKGLAL